MEIRPVNVDDVVAVLQLETRGKQCVTSFETRGVIVVKVGAEFGAGGVEERCGVQSGCGECHGAIGCVDEGVRGEGGGGRAADFEAGVGGAEEECPWVAF